jgi:hypothetical protein
MVLELDEICGADPEEENQPHDGTVLDLKPEFCQYQDEGCRHAPSCLKCPFPHCLYEEKRRNNHWRKEIRNEKIMRLHAAGKNVRQLAARFKLSERMVEKIIKEDTQGKRSSNE